MSWRLRGSTCFLRVLALAAGVLAVSASATDSANADAFGDQLRVSFTGADGNSDFGSLFPSIAESAETNQFLVAWNARTNYSENRIRVRLLDVRGRPLGLERDVSSIFGLASAPSVVHNSRRDEYLVVWGAIDPSTTDTHVVYARRLDRMGDPLGPIQVISGTRGLDASGNRGARDPTAAYNEDADEYLVAWSGARDMAPAADEEEIYVQRLNGVGAQIGPDRRVSSTGPAGSADYDTTIGDVVYNDRSHEYLVCFSADAYQIEDDPADGTRDDRSDAAEGPAQVGPPVAIRCQRLDPQGTQIGRDDFDVNAGKDRFANPGLALMYEMPRIAFNPRANEYMVTWGASGQDYTRDNQEGADASHVLTQIISRTGRRLTQPESVVSSSRRYQDGWAVAAYSPTANRYLVAFERVFAPNRQDEDADARADVRALQFSAGGRPLSRKSQRISSPADAGRPDALPSELIFDAPGNRYITTWTGYDQQGLQVDGHTEVFARSVPGT